MEGGFPTLKRRNALLAPPAKLVAEADVCHRTQRFGDSHYARALRRSARYQFTGLGRRLAVGGSQEAPWSDLFRVVSRRNGTADERRCTPMNLDPADCTRRRYS